jgi:branched-chain amino acid transport system permease protein
MIDHHLLISGIIFGLSMGSIFFLMAIGLSLCFGLMRIISMDQLLYYAVGAYVTYTVSLWIGQTWPQIGVWGVWVGAVAGVAISGACSPPARPDNAPAMMKVSVNRR